MPPASLGRPMPVGEGVGRAEELGERERREGMGEGGRPGEERGRREKKWVGVREKGEKN